MEFKTVGGDGGLRVSAISIGCNAFGARCDEAQTASIVHQAIESGINFFDTANTYGDGRSEEFIGTALGARRGDVIVATKFGMRDGGSPKVIAASVEASLKRLGTDYIDLYQLHKPDAATPIEETLKALDGLVRDGKVRFIGCSNFSGSQLNEAMACSSDMGLASFVTAQNAYSLLQRDIEGDLVPVCRDHGVGILPFYPLQRGLLTGKYRAGEAPPEGSRLAQGGGGAELLNDKNFDRIAALQEFAEARGHGLLELAISWLASQPVISSVIAGVSKPEQVIANVAAAGWALTAADFAALDEIVAPPEAVMG
jgi:aryl-alcohol dehydrogenase-like predicted oxidoreductase